MHDANCVLMSPAGLRLLPALDRIPLWIPLAVMFCYALAGIGSYGLLDNNEGLYAEVAREMLASGDYVLPSLNGLPYFEKPPLFYYLIDAAFALFGESAFSARLVSGAASLVCLLGLLGFSARLGKAQGGRLAALILTSAAGYVIMSRAVMPDMLLTAWFNLALFGFYLALRERRRAWLRASYMALALAVLTKGLVALALYALVCGSTLLLQRKRLNRETLRLLVDPTAIALFLLLAVPWHVLATLRNADFAWFYLINEHVLRFLGLREPHDYYSGSPLYYLPRVLLFLFPWPAYLLLMARKPRQAPDAATADLQSFLWLAWLLPLAFFSLSSAKGNYYMVIAMPPLALLVALRIEALAAEGWRKLLAIPIALPLLGIATVIGMYLMRKYGHAEHPSFPSHFQLRAIAVGAFLLLGACSFALMHRGRLIAGMVVASLMFAPFMGVYLGLMDQREPYISSRPLAEKIDALCIDCRVFIYKDFEKISALPFHLKRLVGVIDSASNDLYFAQHRYAGSAAHRFAFVAAGELLNSSEPQLLHSLVVVHDQRMVDFENSAFHGRVQALGKVGRVSIFRRFE